MNGGGGKRVEILKRDRHKCVKCGCWTTDSRWESKSQKYVYFWWGKDKEVFEDLGNGVKQIFVMPEMTPAPKQYYLNIHHKFYIRNRLPWDYSNDILITLCNWCHDELHKNEMIKVYDDQLNEIKNMTPCSRCGGRGWFPEYDHVEAGICFKCRGAKFDELVIFKVE